MGRSVARCMKVAELVSELRKHDGDLIVRFRDGDAVYPGVYVMREDRTDHVDVGSPYPVRDRMAEVDAAVRKADGRPPRRSPKARVLVRRYKSKRTEWCDTFVFMSRRNACRKAASLLGADMRTYGNRVTSTDIWNEEKAMIANLRSEFSKHVVQLTNGDNVVYELYGRGVRK